MHQSRDSSGGYNKAFALGTGMNLFFALVEAGFGIYAGSLALIADAGHNLSDVFSLLLAWGAAFMASRSASRTRTYGFRKLTILSSLLSAVLLLLALGVITWEALGRLVAPEPVDGPTVIVVALIGVIVNTITALLFFPGQKHDLNIRGAFLHMAADAGVSLGVVVAGILIILKGWLWIDPVISLLVVVIILVGTWRLLWEALNLAIDAVPRGIDLDEIEEYLAGLEDVRGIHDLHVWAMSTTEIALTVHLVVKGEVESESLLEEIQLHLARHFGIEHPTIQIELEKGKFDCLLGSQSH